MIKIEFPADDKVAASAFAAALQHIANGGKLSGNGLRTEPVVVPSSCAENSDEEDCIVENSPSFDTEETYAAAAEGALINLPYRAIFAKGSDQDPFCENEAQGGPIDTTSAPLDVHGVPFDEKYCSKAAEPYYATGKRSGQWKKRKGVSDETYDAWYASLDPRASKAAEEPQVIDSSQAFTPQKQQAPAAPKDVGAFMTWVSEYQAAGALTQDKINAAWSEAGVQIGDLFNAPPETVEQRIKTVYDILVAKL